MQITAVDRIRIDTYLMWRVLTGLHEEITISFLLVGHTKFAPDWCFGLFKRLFKRTKVGSLEEIAAVVDRSATCNYQEPLMEEWLSFFIIGVLFLMSKH